MAGPDLMGKVLVAARIVNLEDEFMGRRGVIPPNSARSVEVADALIDTGVTQLSLPRHSIEKLGLRPSRVRQARTAVGSVTVQVYEAVRLEVQGRDCLSDVTELPDECPALIGQIPLEQMDFVVDPRGQRLIGNPAHGGEHVIELY